jgi:hypothetical protein
LLLSHILARNGIDSVVLERQSRRHVLRRIRAGVSRRSAVMGLRGSSIRLANSSGVGRRDCLFAFSSSAENSFEPGIGVLSSAMIFFSRPRRAASPVALLNRWRGVLNIGIFAICYCYSSRIHRTNFSRFCRIFSLVSIRRFCYCGQSAGSSITRMISRGERKSWCERIGGLTCRPIPVRCLAFQLAKLGLQSWLSLVHWRSSRLLPTRLML